MDDFKKNGPEPYLLVDGHGLAYRAYYAMPELVSRDGMPTGAIQGFMNMLLKVQDDLGTGRIALFFDPKGPTQRCAMFEKYKEGRRPTPDDFKQQMPVLHELLLALGYGVFVRDGVEADDMIISSAAALSGDVLILTADKDILQAVSENVRVMRPVKGVSEFKIYGPELFASEYGFPHFFMADYLALTGDKVDNIPGVAGIGEKGAADLVAKYGPLEEIYAHLGELSKGMRAKLEAGYEDAYMSRSLIVPLETEPVGAELIKVSPPSSGALEICASLGLRKIAARLGGAPAAKPKPKKAVVETIIEAPAAAATAVEYTEGAFEDVRGAGDIALLYQANGDHPGGFSVGWVRVCTPHGLYWEAVRPSREALHELLGGKRCTMYGYKEFCIALGGNMPKMEVWDAKLWQYALHPDRGDTKHAGMPPEELYGVAAKPEDIWGIRHILSAHPMCGQMKHIVEDIDTPLSEVLADMESSGFGLRMDVLASLETDLITKISEIERAVASYAGGDINLNSPKQVAQLLFGQLGLPPVRKTKTGFSTDSDVLEELCRLPAPMGAVPALIMEHREASKMLSGFVQPFIAQGRKCDSRVYTKLEQTATGTGRLSSRDPNLQNLPTFGAFSHTFRSAIVPRRSGNVFVSADYSQIELRVLAHMCGEERLLAAFAAGHDIHRQTASWVYGVASDDVTPQQRRFAKVINFGLLYGMGAHGLSTRMGITRSDAAQIVERYFAVLPGVRDYLQTTVDEAKTRGYTLTLAGRVRPLAEVSTVEGRGHGAIDRVAVNTPIQGTAADIARVAMMQLYKVLREKYSYATLLLQVHDSLVCEVPAEQADEVERVMKDVMENVVSMAVPLEVVAHRGASIADL